MRKHISFFFSVLFLAIATNAQQKGKDSQLTGENKTVLITESSLVSIAKKLQKFKEERNKKLISNNFEQTRQANFNDNYLEKALLQQEIERLNNQLNQYQLVSKQPQKSFTNDYYIDRINDLQNQLFELRKLLNNFMEEDKQNIITIPERKVVETEKSVLTNNKKNQKTIEQRIDTLYIALNNADKKDSIFYVSQTSILKKQLNELTNKINKPVEELSSKNLTVTVPLNDYKKQLFFDNNKISLKETDMFVLSEILNLINQHDNLDVLIKGFASNTGSPIYNENLSLLRTESVKKALIRLGVHPSRILTQYHGIDYAEANEALARRVDLSLLKKQ
jgi:outer membrane protein OmpA-like peptidoglycan-associated protein